MTTSPTDRPYRLVTGPAPVAARPHLDPAQQAVVDRVAVPGCGPLLVLAGPGTGKSTTLVEAVVARVESGTSPERVLTLTFSRKAAGELRDRITARLGRALELQPAWTFHAFCLALLSEARVPEDAGRPLRLLSGPEQDVHVRELLAGDLADGGRDWPIELGAALGTRGFADEVRALLARARGYGLEPPDLARVVGGRPDWVAAARFMDTYLTVLDDLGALDYAELVQRAVVLAESPTGREALRARFDLVVVDEYQDTDPGQERLLQALAGEGRDLVAVGDPDQSIYAFRGADVHGLLDFRNRFARRDGQPAEVLTLAVSRRAGDALLAASRTVARRMPWSGAGLSGVLAEHRALQAADGLPPGEVVAWTFPSASAQFEAVADVLRRENLDTGTPWSAMAVLVRSGARSIPLVQRALGAAGVPVEVAGDELPLAREAAVAPLLLALRVCVDPGELTQEVARVLLLSPLGGVDSSALRRLGRLLRARERERGHGDLPRPSSELIREVLVDPSRLDELSDPEAGRRAEFAVDATRRLGQLLGRAAERVRAGGSTHDVLWLLWDATAWPRRLERSSAAGGSDGRAADRDLDAVVALFEAATRDEERAQRRGASAFLDELGAQQIPADTLAERATRGEAVRLLTAHRSKGLEWDVVVVCDVQEEAWPDLRRRGSLLEADRLRPDGLAEPPTPSELLAEERRLFYVAVTRARRRLIVTAVDSPEDDGQRPSRFLSELGVAVMPVTQTSRRPLTLAALVVELRSVVADPQVPAGLRQAAAVRLARLASARAPGGSVLVPAAHPDTWWGLDDVTASETPLHRADQPLPLSASSLSGLGECPLRWFLEHEAGGQSARSSALGFGSVVHALADGVARGDYEDDVDALMVRVESVWDQLAFEASWQSESQQLQARAALQRFLDWHAAQGVLGRDVVGSEVRFTTTLLVGDREVLLRGSMDRVEVDTDGRVVVVDLKTGKTKPTNKDVEVHPQLGLYQLAVRNGALDDLPAAAGRDPGGAELVHLRLNARGGLPDVQAQPAPDPGHPVFVEEQLAEAVARLVAEDFPPTPGKRCGMCTYRRSCPAQPDGRGVIT